MYVKLKLFAGRNISHLRVTNNIAFVERNILQLRLSNATYIDRKFYIVGIIKFMRKLLLHLRDYFSCGFHRHCYWP